MPTHVQTKSWLESMTTPVATIGPVLHPELAIMQRRLIELFFEHEAYLKTKPRQFIEELLHRTMKLLLAILLVTIGAGLGVLAVAAALWKLDHVTGAFADFNTFIFCAYALALATLLALCAWWLTEDAR